MVTVERENGDVIEEARRARESMLRRSAIFFNRAMNEGRYCNNCSYYNKNNSHCTAYGILMNHPDDSTCYRFEGIIQI